MANPRLELRDNDGALILANDDWQDDSGQAALITAAGLAPANVLESALVVTVSPGTYTGIVQGVGGLTGICYVQFYTLPHFGDALPLVP